MGRPKKKKSDLRSEWVATRLTPEELGRVQSAAEGVRRTVAEFVRLAILDAADAAGKGRS